MKSNIMKGISYAVLIVGLLGSIIYGAIFKTYNFEKQEFVFNIELTMISIIMVLLLFVIMFALSTLLEEIEMLKINQKDLSYRVEKIIDYIETKPNLENTESFSFSKKKNTYEEPVEKFGYTAFGDIFWTCPNCGRQNQSIKCYGCGLTKEEANKNSN